MKRVEATTRHLEQREAEAPGYTRAIEPAIVERRGEVIVLDADHPAWAAAAALRRGPRRQRITGEPQEPTPIKPRRQPAAGASGDGGGPGTELKRMLGRLGIKPSANCRCNARARKMDEQGVDWCRANVETIVGWLREEAEHQGLPFSGWLAGKLVRRAIRKSEKQ